MRVSTELKIMEHCKGMTIAQTLHRLDIMDRHIENRKLTLRVKTTNLTIGE